LKVNSFFSLKSYIINKVVGNINVMFNMSVGFMFNFVVFVGYFIIVGNIVRR